MSTTIIYDDEEIRVIWVPRTSRTLVITFGDMIGLVNDRQFFADVPLRKLEISAIGVMAKRANWYPQENVRKAVKYILEKTAGYERRIVYGGSMGGYAAIKFSHLLDATHVVSLCPQWSLDPGECRGVDPGWNGYFSPTLRGMGIRAGDVAGEVFIFADSFNSLDMFHSRMIIENYPSAHFINVPMVDHGVTAVFAGTVNLQELLDACNVVDMTALRRISRRMRKSHAIWKDRWLSLAMRKHPRLGIPYLIDPNNRDQLRKNWRYFPIVLAHLARTVGAPRAVAFYDAAWSLLPGPVEQHLICACLVGVAGGKVAIATTHKSWLIYDLSQNAVIHKVTPLSRWDIPVEAELRGLAAALFVTVGGTRFPLSVADSGWLDVAVGDGRGGERYLFKAALDGNGRFTLSQDGKYLSAEAAGSLVCNRDSASDWEMFRFGPLSEVESVNDAAKINTPTSA